MLKLIFIYTFYYLLLLPCATAQTSIISYNSSWKYLDNGSNQGSNWRSATFKDSKWKTGNGKFGYGISDASTIISFGTSTTKKYITTYFRKSVSISDPTLYSSFTANVKRDDGVVVYINNKEVYRNNIPSGTVAFTTLATEAADNGTLPQSFSINTSTFVKGTNIIAVEIHQASANTPDMAFDLELIGIAKILPPADQTPPTITSINRQSPSSESTSASSLTFRVTFSEQVKGVDATDFTATATGSASGAVASVVAVGTTGSVYDVLVNAVAGEGTLRLDLKSNGTGITDLAGNAIAGGYNSGQSYIIFIADQTPPNVTSINRQNPTTETVTASSLVFRCTFSEKVSGVDATDFTLTVVSGSVSGTLPTDAVTAVGTAGTTYDVAVNAVVGDGALRLDLNSSGTGIADIAGNPLSEGYSSGQIYIIEQTAVDQPRVLYYEGFESGAGFSGMNIQTSTTYGFNVVGNPTYQDLKVGRWELRAGDPPASNGTRAEVLFSEDLAKQETWHSFVGYFPSEDNLIDTDDEAFNQWHQGSSFGRPMMTFRTENGRFEVLRRSPDGTKTHYYIMGSIIYDQWVHFVIHIKQHLTDGIMQVWINGELKMDYQGPTMFDGPIGRWKMGIYKSSWNNGAKTNSVKRVWYVDEVKVGNAASTYETIKPVSGNNVNQLGSAKTSNLEHQPGKQSMNTEQPGQIAVYPTFAKRGVSITLNVNDNVVHEALVSDATGRLLRELKFKGGRLN